MTRRRDVHPAEENETVALYDLGVTSDPGTEWHPRDKPGARDDSGDLIDLSDLDVLEHQAKPEVAGQPDAGLLLAAEDSTHSHDDEV
jgi:hypothetical protein